MVFPLPHLSPFRLTPVLANRYRVASPDMETNPDALFL
jgi:hypothetical protein